MNLSEFLFNPCLPVALSSPTRRCENLKETLICMGAAGTCSQFWLCRRNILDNLSDEYWLEYTPSFRICELFNSGRTVQVDYPAMRANFSLRLGSRLGRQW